MIQSILSKSAIVCALICILLVGNFSHPLYLIPLSYSIMMAFWSRKEPQLAGPGITVLSICMFCRYSLVPLSYYLFKGYSLYSPEHFDDAILMMIYEQIVIFVFLIITSSRVEQNISLAFGQIRRPTIIVFILCFLGLALSFSSTAIDTGFAVLASRNLSNFFDIDSYSPSFTQQLLVIVWDVSLFCLYISLVSWLAINSYQNSKRIYVFIAVILTLALAVLTFANQTGGMARWQTIVFTVSGIFYIMKLFPENRVFALITIITPLVILMSIATMVKNGGYDMTSSNESYSEALEITFGPESMDAYFDGPDGVSTAICLKEKSDLDITSMFHDMIHGIPIIHKFENQQLLTNARFNALIGKMGVIAPFSGQAAIYFGYVLFPLLVLIILGLIRMVDKLFKMSQDYFAYFYAFAGIWLAMSITLLNFTILNNWISTKFLPLWLALLLMDKLSIKIE